MAEEKKEEKKPQKKGFPWTMLIIAAAVLWFGQSIMEMIADRLMGMGYTLQNLLRGLTVLTSGLLQTFIRFGISVLLLGVAMVLIFRAFKALGAWAKKT